MQEMNILQWKTYIENNSLTSEEWIEDIWFNKKEKSIQTNKGPFKSKSG